jgi:structural maintenance of chromosome 4
MVSKQENQGSINQLENEVNDLQAQYEVVQSRILHLNPMIESLQNQIQELDMNQSRLKLEIESNQVQIKDFQASIETAKKNMKADPVDIQRSNELEKKILKTKSSLEKLLLQCKPIEDEIKECQDQIMQVGGVRLRTQKAKVDSLSDQITQQQLWVSKLLAEKQGREKRVLKSVSVIEKHEGELIEIEKELDHVTQEYQESIEKNEKVDEEKSKLQEKISILNKTRALQVGMKAEMASIKHIISSNEKKIEKCGIELEQISLVSTGYFIFDID